MPPKDSHDGMLQSLGTPWPQLEQLRESTMPCLAECGISSHNQWELVVRFRNRVSLPEQELVMATTSGDQSHQRAAAGSAPPTGLPANDSAAWKEVQLGGCVRATHHAKKAWRWLVLASALGLVGGCLCALASARSVCAARQAETCSDRSAGWRCAAQAAVVGTELAAAAVVASLITWLPGIIVMWTTALVLSVPGYVAAKWRWQQRRSRKESLVRGGRRLARELSSQAVGACLARAGPLVAAALCLASFLLVWEAYDGGCDCQGRA